MISGTTQISSQRRLALMSTHCAGTGIPSERAWASNNRLKLPARGGSVVGLWLRTRAAA